MFLWKRMYIFQTHNQMKAETYALSIRLQKIEKLSDTKRKKTSSKCILLNVAFDCLGYLYSHSFSIMW